MTSPARSRVRKTYPAGRPHQFGLMVGLGESPDEVHRLLRDILSSQVDVATIGQYLQPTRRNLPVAEYVTPALQSQTPTATTAFSSDSKWFSAAPLFAAPTWPTASVKKPLADPFGYFDIEENDLLEPPNQFLSLRRH